MSILHTNGGHEPEIVNVSVAKPQACIRAAGKISPFRLAMSPLSSAAPYHIKVDYDKPAGYSIS